MALQTERKAKSPYQRYKKVPLKYSDAHGRWKSAVKRGDQRAAGIASADHSKFLREVLGWRPDTALAR